MKQFTIPCEFQGGMKSPVTFYIGAPEGAHHPIHFQSDWLSKNRGGTVPPDVMDALTRLKKLADKNGVVFEDLAFYAMRMASESSDNKDAYFDTILEGDPDDEGIAPKPESHPSFSKKGDSFYDQFDDEDDGIVFDKKDSDEQDLDSDHESDEQLQKRIEYKQQQNAPANEDELQKQIPPPQSASQDTTDEDEVDNDDSYDDFEEPADNVMDFASEEEFQEYIQKLLDDSDKNDDAEDEEFEG